MPLLLNELFLVPFKPPVYTAKTETSVCGQIFLGYIVCVCVCVLARSHLQVVVCCC